MTRIFGILIAVLFLSVGHTASGQDSELLKKAQDGDADAQVSLGYDYLFGMNVEQDSAEAVKWWQMAAEQGNADAQYALGNAYEDGKGIEKDFAKALKWYRLAAEQGDDGAQHSLAAAYFLGQGVIKDSVYAHMWYNISSSLGNRFAAIGRDSLSKEMTPEQIAEAQKLARECVRKAYKNC